MPAKRIKLFRTAKGLTQRQLAEMMNVDPHTVYLWEKGERAPAYRKLVAMQKLLGVPRHVFFAEELDVPTEEAG